MNTRELINDVLTGNVDCYRPDVNNLTRENFLSEDKTKKRNEELQIKVLKSNIHYKERTPIENFKHSKGFTMLKDLSSGGSGRYYTRCQIVGIMKVCNVDRYDADKLFREYDGYGGKFDEKTLGKLYN